MFNHTCIDIETLSTQSNAVIVSIAAVKFNFNTEEIETFCVDINPKESKELGLHVSKDTLDWWRQQKPEVVKSWIKSNTGISDALSQFLEFCPPSNTMRYWCLGNNFDFPIMESSFRATNKVAPWKYYNLSDMRTAYYLAGLSTSKEERVGLYHNALDDCLTQIKWLRKALGK